MIGFVKRLHFVWLAASMLWLTGCGFHFQGDLNLAPPLHTLYLQAADPYGYLVRILKQYLRMSGVHLVGTLEASHTGLIILQDEASQEFLSVSFTNQTRQINLRVRVVFEITDNQGRVIVGPQTLEETRPITIQANQILGSSNETTLFYQQMRRDLAYAIMNRIASKEITNTITAYTTPKKATVKTP